MICDLTGQQLRVMVDEILDRWRDGDPPDACAVLREYPQLRNHHSLAVDLAYEEYCLREESGESLNPRQFCARFSQLQHSLARMLDLHQALHSTAMGQNLAARDNVDWPRIGERWLDWLLVEEIGRGAFSRVFLAEEPSLGNRRVVVKCATSGAGEAFLLGKLAHPSVMPIHSIRHDDKRQFVGICMPYVGRVTLADALNRLIDPESQHVSTAIFTPRLEDWQSAVPQSKTSRGGIDYTLHVARLMEKIARGLVLAHRENILHGDIKPSNIILSFDGQPMLVDFNLSDGGGKETGKLGGTPPYMAPERLALLTPFTDSELGRTQTELTLRSDIFSLGVVLYELLYGDTPYDFTVDDLIPEYRVKSSPLFPERSAAGERVPGELTDLIARAIALDPGARCLSIQEFADELANVIKKYSPKSQPRTMSWLGGAAVAALLALAPTPFIASSLWDDHDAPPSAANPTPEVEPDESAERRALREGISSIERKDYSLAASQLQSIPKEHRGREVEAWIGFCLAQVEQYPSAKFRFEKAQPELDETGTLWHNIGCCELQLVKPHLALQCFSLAVTCNPHRSESYRQLAITKCRLALRERTAPPEETYEDLECALSLSGDDPYLMLDAAYICATGMNSNRDRFEAPCHKYTRRALELGVPPALLRELFANEAEFTSLLPAALPEPLARPSAVAMFLPPPYDLRDVIVRLP
jgi:serine/threonine protein kinase